MSDYRQRDAVSGLPEPCFFVDERRLTRECGQAVLDEILEVRVLKHLSTNCDVPNARSSGGFALDEYNINMDLLLFYSLE
jgi:hypothetical protein